AQAVEASATLPRALGRVRGGRLAHGVVSFGTKYVSPGRSRTFLFSAQVGRRAAGRVVEVSARAAARDDLDPRDNYAVDRDRLLAAKRKRTRKAAAPYDSGAPENAARESRIAASTASMPAAEPLALPAGSGGAWVATFGQLCRVPAGV
ncbi:MAG: hypothetical protein M3340_15700, partial [Actinomycetota bacterium]|nr:hypothetical protein [Actinomycetota bacterium]